MFSTSSSLNTSYHLFSNMKLFYRLEKYLPIEREFEDSYFSNQFINQLKFPQSVVNILNTNVKLKTRLLEFDFHSKLNKDINIFIKRNFHSIRSNNKISEEAKQLESVKKILENYSSKPNIQKDIFETYHLGYERSLNSKKNEKTFFEKIGSLVTASFLIFIGYILYQNISNSGVIKIFSKNFTDGNITLINKTGITFDDVQGCEEIKKELEDVVYFLKNPSAFTNIGAQLPRGIILSGPPGVGKTLLAKAVAGEAGVTFLFTSGSQFDEMFVGTGASRVRNLFSMARENSPCIVFIDELDAVCGERTSSTYYPFANQTINQLLSEMDGFTDNDGVIIIGATNRVEVIDKAVLRPGRFDLKITVHPPDYLGRMSLFNLYLSKIKKSDDIDVSSLSKATVGSNGADIKNLINQAAIICAIKNDPMVSMDHIWEAESKILMGSVRNKPSLVSENRNTAFHESGHCIVGYFTPNHPGKIKQITILPRGNSGGHSSLIPKEDSYNMSKNQLLAVIDSLMGGRAAEELLNGSDNISTGIYDDLQRATKYARSMVMSYSMSEDVGLQTISDGNCSCGGRPLSGKLADTIDIEVNKILKESYERAKSLIQQHEKEWNAIATYLLKYETLKHEDIELIIQGKKPKVAIIHEEIQKNKKSFVDATSNQLLGLFSGKNTKK